jgi:carbamoyltransferase
MADFILGISAYYHDSAAVLLKDGDIIAAAQEERFTRKKHDEGFPANACAYVLKEGGITLAEVSNVVFYEKPFLKFERLLETYHAFAPRGLTSFLAAIPVWIKEKLFMRKMLMDEMRELPGGEVRVPPFLFPEHHLSHAASAFFPSPFESAAVVTVDGVGEWSTTTICKGSGKNLDLMREITFPHSLGLLYSAFTAYCGFKVNSGEYKLMGLAPYGSPNSEETARFERVIREELIDIRPDGSYLLNMEHFRYATGLRMYARKGWKRLFGLEAREPETDITQPYMNLALAIQRVTEDVVLRLAGTARELTGERHLCLAGGVALNCVANGKLLRQGIFDDIWIQPAAGDAGGSLGAVLAAWHLHRGRERTPAKPDSMRGAYLGPRFHTEHVDRVSRRFEAPRQDFSDFNELCDTVADLLAQGQVVGWFQGRMEYGPRALGNRSILGDPRSPQMQKKLNLKIKFREGFRPFAPSVLEEKASEVFELDRPSPYMLLVAQVAESMRHPLPEGYEDMAMYDRLYVTRSEIPAVTHVDNSARIQSVARETNERYWTLIDTFNRRHGCPLLVNTSFNVRGEPIVCTPFDAYTCFMRTEMDYLVVGNSLFAKSEQPDWSEAGDWRQEFALD